MQSMLCLDLSLPPQTQDVQHKPKNPPKPEQLRHSPHTFITIDGRHCNGAVPTQLFGSSIVCGPCPHLTYRVTASTHKGCTALTHHALPRRAPHQVTPRIATQRQRAAGRDTPGSHPWTPGHPGITGRRCPRCEERRCAWECRWRPAGASVACGRAGRR